MHEADTCPRAEGAHPTAVDPAVRLLERLAHDLRGPLSPIQTATYLLRQGGLEASRREELLDILDRQAQRLSSMVQEIADWTSAREGRLVARSEAIEVPLLLDLAAATLDSVADWQVADDVRKRIVRGDAQRLVQMLGSLGGFLHMRAGLDAIRALAHGDTLRLELDSREPWEGAEGRLLFEGPHPSPPDHGLGMGLLLAREIARAHGGDVDPGESAAGGARLRVKLPLVPG